MTNSISPISFQGLKIKGIVSAGNIKKLGEFANATENRGFIEDLEKLYNTDMVLNGELNEISFSHKVYGDLDKYGAVKFAAKDFYSNVVTVMGNIKSAIKKAEREFNSVKKKNDYTPRGC